MARRERVGELIGLIDRLEDLMARSALGELELEVGDTSVTLRSPAAIAPPAVVAATPGAAEATADMTTASAIEPEVRGGYHVVAPLTGVFYLSPSPGADPYVREGGQVSRGQVIGLIEAMKLFNEIKSDVTGTVRRLLATDGDLVKAKQVLIEVDPA